jgi:NAD(P)-dependent dehydrogenase (short-subunit alcohol dehydrogenase family)
MQELAGKVAVITGGASGIGLATARALARERVSVVLADIEQTALDAAVASLRDAGADATGIRTDVGDKTAVDALADASWDRFGGVHILFNNAGIVVTGPTQEATHADWEWSVRVNLWGPIHGVEAFVPRMIAQRQAGHLLFTASFAGLVGNRQLGPYCVTKFGVVALAECLHKDLREHGIGVSVLAPMRVKTRIDTSHRNRPAELGGPSTARALSEEDKAALSGRELPVELIGDLVVAAIRRNELYIHTHNEAREFVRRRCARLDAAFAHAL